jgi:eukaryotic-like serine/threonine-protein kinase
MAATSSPTSRRLPTLAKYEVLEELGHGGMATVYRAHDKRLARDVAVKVIHPHLRDSKEVQSRFFVEAKAVAKLRHPNIVEVFDVSGEDEHEQYLVVELLRGQTLRKLLRENGAIPPEIAAALGLELLSALSHAHGAGVVHRDVKPENVILEHHAQHGATAPSAMTTTTAAVPSGRPPPSGETPGERVVVKLTDFGIAKLLDAQGVTSTGQVLGSPAHMAPEQIEGGDVDARADVFGMGVLLSECMVGHLPFEGNNPAQVLRRVLDGTYAPAERERPEIGKAYSAILDRALARQPADRFPSCGDLKEALASELRRVGVTGARGELESWFDDPAAYAAAHKKRMIAKMCELGSAARREGKVLAAAADYNRALAYAPDDAQLLRIVTGMHRAEARARLVKKLLPAILGALLLGVMAFFVTRALKAGPAAAPAVDAGAIALVRPEPSTAPVVRADPSASPSGSAPLVVAPPIPIALRPLPVASAAAPTRRTITIAKIRPVAGVLVAVDGDPAIEAASGKSITLDGKPHALVFSCIEDLCEPQTRNVAGESVEMDLKIKPAKLTIAGDPTRSYVIKEKPILSVNAGGTTDVPMTRKSELFHVRQLGEHEREVTVTLTAGQVARAVFSEEP